MTGQSFNIFSYSFFNFLTKTKTDPEVFYNPSCIGNNKFWTDTNNITVEYSSGISTLDILINDSNIVFDLDNQISLQLSRDSG